MQLTQGLIALLSLTRAAVSDPLPASSGSTWCKHGPIILQGRQCEKMCGYEFLSGGYKYDYRSCFDECAVACAADARCVSSKWSHTTKNCYYLDESRQPYWQKTAKADGIKCKPKCTTMIQDPDITSESSTVPQSTASSFSACPTASTGTANKRYVIQCDVALQPVDPSNDIIANPQSRRRQAVSSFAQCQAACDNAASCVGFNSASPAGGCTLFRAVQDDTVIAPGNVAARVTSVVSPTTTSLSSSASSLTSSTSSSSLSTTQTSSSSSASSTTSQTTTLSSTTSSSSSTTSQTTTTSSSSNSASSTTSQTTTLTSNSQDPTFTSTTSVPTTSEPSSTTSSSTTDSTTSSSSDSSSPTTTTTSETTTESTSSTSTTTTSASPVPTSCSNVANCNQMISNCGCQMRMGGDNVCSIEQTKDATQDPSCNTDTDCAAGSSCVMVTNTEMTQYDGDVSVQEYACRAWC